MDPDNFRYKNKLVAELAWVIRSAPSMSNSSGSGLYSTLDRTWCHEQFEFHKNWLDYLDEQPEEIEKYFQQSKTLLLGKRFEAFVQFWFEESPFFELLAYNVQLSNNGRTIGEIDFIVKDNRSDETLHIEAACKFYLSNKNSQQWKHWVGPNGNDNLQLKMNKLDKQLAICSTIEGKEFLSKNAINQPIACLFMKGYFFHHYRILTQSIAPSSSASNYNVGWWLYESEMQNFFSPNSMWVVLEKENWLAPYSAQIELTKIKYGKDMSKLISALIRKHKRAIMLVQVEIDNDIIFEVSRGLVVTLKK